MYPLVRELAVEGIPVTVTCRVLKIARQPYYRWLADPVTDVGVLPHVSVGVRPDVSVSAG